MIKKLSTILFFCCFSICFNTEVFSFDTKQVSITNSGAYINDFNIQELQNFYAKLEFPNYLKPNDNIYPRVFVKKIPHDYAQIKDKTLRNEIFIKMLMPLVLKVNQEYEEERANLEAIWYGFNEEKDFHELDCYYIDQLAEKYEVATPYKDTRKYIILLEELRLRVGPVPPSILVAAAAIYTDWGTSRIAVEANNLYKARNWYSEEGLEPASDDKDYKYKIYDSLEDSIRDYILKVNISVNYSAFWQSRKAVMEQQAFTEDSVYGKRIDWSFVLDNNLSNYAGLLDYTLTYYHMNLLDRAELETEYDFGD